MSEMILQEARVVPPSLHSANSWKYLLEPKKNWKYFPSSFPATPILDNKLLSALRPSLHAIVLLLKL